MYHKMSAKKLTGETNIKEEEIMQELPNLLPEMEALDLVLRLRSLLTTQFQACVVLSFLYCRFHRVVYCNIHFTKGRLENKIKEHKNAGICTYTAALP